MVPVKSSNVASVGYDNINKTLHIRFLYGGIYQYENVPLPVYYQLLLAESKGKFINKNLKEYKYKKINYENK